MSKQDRIERKITGSMTAEIQGKLDEIESPLFAINWFDTRIALIYHLYNLLAASRVFKIGGKALFKGKCLEKISGSPDLARDYLLIVNYPSGHRFLDLLADRQFQLMSVLRMAAVKRFSFVLHQRQGEPQLLSVGKTTFDPNDHYAVLQVRLPQNEKATSASFDFAGLEQLVQGHDAEVFFASRVAGQIVINHDKKNEAESLPFETDITVLIKSLTEQNILNCFAANQVESLLPTGAEFFAAPVKRTM